MVRRIYSDQNKTSPPKTIISDEDQIEEIERQELRKLIITSSDKKVPLPEPGKVVDSPELHNKKEACKVNLNPDFLFQPFDENLMEIHVLLPPKSTNQEYTLVLDLDETLIHFDKDKKLFFVRPYARHFLRELSKHYEIVIFTAAMKDYTDFILERVDTENTISHKLYREQTTFYDKSFIKVE